MSDKQIAPSGSGTAVVLYGLLREYRITAPSLMRHVVEPNDASIFYFGPAETDRPTNAYFGVHDERGFLMKNPKASVDALAPLEDRDLVQVYGARLKAHVLHRERQSRFIAEAAAACDEDDWLMGLNPYRIFSMFYNLQGALNLVANYEQRFDRRFETIVITRPDLAFYNFIPAEAKRGEVHVAAGQGFTESGTAHQGNAPVYHYKNVVTGDFVPGNMTAKFNDQLLVLNRGDAECLMHVYDQLAACIEARVPPSPETILYLLAIGRGGLRLVEHPEWNYEIYRTGAPLVQSVLDLPVLGEIDPYHPRLKKSRRAKPLRPVLREVPLDGHWEEAPGSEDSAAHVEAPPPPPPPPLTLYKRYRKVRRAVLNVGLRIQGKPIPR